MRWLLPKNWGKKTWATLSKKAMSSTMSSKWVLILITLFCLGDIDIHGRYFSFMSLQYHLCPLVQLFALLFFYTQKVGKEKLFEDKTQNKFFHVSQWFFFHKSALGKRSALLLLQKRSVGLQNLIFQKCYFQKKRNFLDV